MRPCTLLLIMVGSLGWAAEHPDEVQRWLDRFGAEVAEADAERDAIVEEAQREHAEAVVKARDRALRGLKRSISSRSPVAEQAATYRAVLMLELDDAEARQFFTAIGTLDQVLADLEPLVEEDFVGNPVVVGGEARGLALKGARGDVVQSESKQLFAVLGPTGSDKVGSGSTASPDGNDDGLIILGLDFPRGTVLESIRVQGLASGTWTSEATGSFWIAGVFRGDTMLNPKREQPLLTLEGKETLQVFCNQGESHWARGKGVKITVTLAGEGQESLVVPYPPP